MNHFSIIFSLLLAFSAHLAAQPIEFAPEGSVWTYTQITFDWGGPPTFEQVEVRYTDNIVVDGINCKRLVAPNGDYYVYQLGDRVYHRRDTGTQFTLLWDFGVMPGDSFVTQSHVIEGIQFSFICVGRDTVVENGIPLPRIDLDVHCQFQSNWVERITINPRYGPMYKQYCPSYLFNTYNKCLVDFPHGFELLSYSDVVFPSILNCPSSTNNLAERLPIMALPNPTNGQIILTNLPDGATFRLFDALGRGVELPASTGTQVDLGQYPNGVYLLEIWVGLRRLQQLRLMKI